MVKAWDLLVARVRVESRHDTKEEGRERNLKISSTSPPNFTLFYLPPPQVLFSQTSLDRQRREE